MSLAPDIYGWLGAASGVTALIGSGAAMRCGSAGTIPQDSAKPYVTWQVISGLPENYLDEAPDIDNFRVQINCWALDPADVDALALAVRSALEPHGHQITVVDDSQDETTKLYRYATDWSFWPAR